MRELSLFTGIGGGLLASKMMGWHTVCGVEIDEYCRRVLRQRQLDGFLDEFPLYGDIREFSGTGWAGKADVVSGGFPCQDISSAGGRQGLEGNRSGLWFEMLRVIGEAQPAYCFIENSPNLRTLGLQVVLQGLADLGFDAQWGVLGAWHVGAPHRRNRIWIAASNPDVCRQRGLPFHAEVGRAPKLAGTTQSRKPSNSNLPGLEVGSCERSDACEERTSAERGSAQGRSNWWSVPSFEGVDDALANRVDRTRASGNGQVAAVAAVAWTILGP